MLARCKRDELLLQLGTGEPFSAGRLELVIHLPSGSEWRPYV